MAFLTRRNRLARAARSSSWLVAMVVVAACGSKSSGGGLAGDDGTGDDGGSGSSSGGSTGFGSSSGGDDGTGGFTGGADGGGLSLTGACSYSTSKGQQRNLDVYIMLDQSASMALEGKWTGVTTAINSFVTQPLTGVSVGIQYFGLSFADCTAADYATPEVEIAPLPGVASKITASIANHAPISGTPTQAAEQGAIQHAQAWAKANPDDAVIVLLATDGDPDACTLLPDPVTPVANEAMAAYAATPSIATFVIGVGSDLANLNQIAAAGGTKTAFIVDTSMNVQTQFLTALNAVRGTALGCQYKIPAPAGGMTIDFTKVNVQFTNGSTKTVFPQVSDVSKCPSSGDAWYYDNDTTPTEIILCSATCGAVSVGGEIDVLTGCQTITK